jgi:hypothetical protein
VKGAPSQPVINIRSVDNQNFEFLGVAEVGSVLTHHFVRRRQDGEIPDVAQPCTRRLKGTARCAKQLDKRESRSLKDDLAAAPLGIDVPVGSRDKPCFTRWALA